MELLDKGEPAMKRRRIRVTDEEDGSAAGPIAEVVAPPVVPNDPELDQVRLGLKPSVDASDDVDGAGGGGVSVETLASAGAAETTGGDEDVANEDVRKTQMLELAALFLGAPTEVERQEHYTAFRKFFDDRKRFSNNFRAGVICRSQPGYRPTFLGSNPVGRRLRLLELFSGTSSVGKVFESMGWEVVSLDWNKRIRPRPTHVCDIRSFDKHQYPPGHFDCIWASPDCAQYSIAHQGPRDYETADSLVQAGIDIMRYYKPVVWWNENPSTGQLRHRAVAEPFGKPHVVHYCKYYTEAEGKQVCKPTALWTGCEYFEPRPLCTKGNRCNFMAGK